MRSGATTSRAMVLDAPRTALEARELPAPELGAHDVLIAVEACGVCRTDLHILDGELTDAKRPVVPGHQIVGRVIDRGAAAGRFAVGARIGVPWLASTCGTCRHCTAGRENLCDQARFTARVGIYGVGAAAHIVIQVARYQGRELYAFTRDEDDAARDFAMGLGARWAGGSSARPPVELDAAIIFAPVGALVPAALASVARGGTVVCAGIHMSDIPSFPYELLWGERCVRSVANLTRDDGERFIPLAEAAGVRTEVTTFGLTDANQALEALRLGRYQGAGVLRCD